MVTRIIVSCIVFILAISAFAQKNDTLVAAPKTEKKTEEKPSNFLNYFKLSGYVQTQFQYGEEKATLSVGGANTSNNDFYRFGIRRGRLKFQFEKNIVLGVFQVDITEKGFALKDAYVQVSDPWTKANSLKAGVFNRPFGYEVSISSSYRLTPERSKVTTTLFPQEREVGAMLTLQAPEKSPWSILKIEAAVVGGNGVKIDVDNKKDFIGSITIDKSFKDKVKLGLGVSYYYGEVYQGSANKYRMEGKSMVGQTDSAFIGKYTKREYFGAEMQMVIKSVIGKTQFGGEYIFGTQPGAQTNSYSPNFTTLPSSDTYIRQFHGGYAYLYQSIGKLPLNIVLKYDFYDPNIKVNKNDIGVSGTGKGDIMYQKLGMGLAWDATKDLRLTAYYDLVSNEKTPNYAAYNKDLKDNVFTFRMQYKF